MLVIAGDDRKRNPLGEGEEAIGIIALQPRLQGRNQIPPGKGVELFDGPEFLQRRLHLAAGLVALGPEARGRMQVAPAIGTA
ncbi:hypothetical protein [Bosea sp. Root381]|uniref:hypothetical protein n=1 Tax=Bosea sp. Root381 TaxID=1736524 RepID=UPI0009E90524|nr:hypothetical protein [Bosea sp. Root381]